jgi:tRNA 5-methylaminomethyl-2-thiouridine biosynthesis bifunctional protein
MRSIAIVGAGLAGAACASAFARAGWRVVVFEQGIAPAAGASGVPIAMFAPSTSSDDAPHSRLLRQGVHLLLDELNRLADAGFMQEGVDWAMTGVLERCLRGTKKLPSTWLAPQDPLGLQSRVLGEPCLARPAGKVQEIFHGAAGWVNPARLISSWLAHPNIELQAQTRVDDMVALDADVIVVACGYQSAQLLPALKTALQPIRGQVEWGTQSKPFDRLGVGGSISSVRAEFVEAVYPINGMGHFIQTKNHWLVGATFQRDDVDLQSRAKDVNMNFEKFALLMPELETSKRTKLRANSDSWVGIRVAQKNRQPLVMQPDLDRYSNLWVCTGLGSRGLSLAALCASRLLVSIQHGLAFG